MPQSSCKAYQAAAATRRRRTGRARKRGLVGSFACCLLPTVCQLQCAGCSLLLVVCAASWEPAAHCLAPAACCLLSTPCCLLLVTCCFAACSLSPFCCPLSTVCYYCLTGRTRHGEYGAWRKQGTREASTVLFDLGRLPRSRAGFAPLAQTLNLVTSNFFEPSGPTDHKNESSPRGTRQGKPKAIRHQPQPHQTGPTQDKRPMPLGPPASAFPVSVWGLSWSLQATIGERGAHCRGLGLRRRLRPRITRDPPLSAAKGHRSDPAATISSDGGGGGSGQ